MSKTRIMIVDDEREFATTLAERLRLRGYDSTVMHSSEEALAAIGEARPDVILLDLRMPGACGIEILMTFRQTAPGAKVILLTGHLDLAKTIEGVRLDCFNIIVKPFDISELVDAIEGREKKNG